MKGKVPCVQSCQVIGSAFQYTCEIILEIPFSFG